MLIYKKQAFQTLSNMSAPNRKTLDDVLIAFRRKYFKTRITSYS